MFVKYKWYSINSNNCYNDGFQFLFGYDDELIICSVYYIC